MTSKTTGNESTRFNLDDTEWYRGELGDATNNFKVRASQIVNVPKIITGGSSLRSDANRWGQYDINAAEFGDINNNARSVIQAAVDYGKAQGIRRLRIPRSDANGGTWFLDGPVFIDDPANLRAGISLANQKLGVTAVPSVFDLGMEVICDFGCTFYPTGSWQTAPMFWIGTSTENRFSGATIIGPRSGLATDVRSLDPRCTGIAIASGNGGAADTVIEDCFIRDVYSGVTMGQNGESALAEDNRFVNCEFAGAYAIRIINSQSFANLVQGGNHTGKLYCFYNQGQDLTMLDGEAGPADQQSVQITVTGASSLNLFTDTLPGGASFTNYTFTMNVTPNSLYAALLDGTYYYNAMVMLLPSFGYVPCVQTGYTAGSITYKFDLGWLWFHFGEEVAATATAIATELAAVTTIYAGQRATVCAGKIAMDNVHIETTLNCALYEGQGNGDRAVFENLDIVNWHPGVTDNDTPTKNINMHTAWVKQNNGDIIFKNSNLITHPSDSTTAGVIIQGYNAPNDQSFNRFIVQNCVGFSRANLRYVGDATPNVGATSRARGPGFENSLTTQANPATKAFGFGEIDFPVWGPCTGDMGDPSLARFAGNRLTKYYGTRPVPAEHARLTSADITALSSLSGTLQQLCGGSLNSIAQIGGQGATHVIDIGGSGFSWYADLNINWSYKGQSQIVNVTSGSDLIKNKLYNGLEIILDNGGGPVSYIITGCYLDDGYITVYRASTTNSVLAGASGTTFTGATIKQRRPVLSFPAQTRTARVAAQYDVTGSTTPANVTGLALYGFTGVAYKIHAVLFTSSNTSGGIQIQISGTAGASSAQTEGVVVSGGSVVGQTRATALGTPLAAITNVSTATVHIDGEITVSATGTITIQFAQNVSNGAASSVLVGSYVELTEIP
jgi:hypothetical protein